jgi:hypothetical protein
MANLFPGRNTGIALEDDARLIPAWSILLAVAAFLAMQYFYWVVLPGHRSHPGPPLGLRLYFALSWGVLAALYFLMLGYVSRDAPRRAMSTRFWMLICFVMPGGIGAVLYFMLRQPAVARCPACATDVQSDDHFCPQCNYQLMASCGQCYRSVRTADLYCTRCGHDLASDNTPRRLRAFES